MSAFLKRKPFTKARAAISPFSVFRIAVTVFVLSRNAHAG